MSSVLKARRHSSPVGSKVGLETARALARVGVKVLICARRQEVLAEAARDVMRSTQAKIETHSLDVTKLEQIETIAHVVKDKLGRSTSSSTTPAPGPTSPSRWDR